MKKRKKIVLVLFVLLLFTSVVYADLIEYGVRVGWGQAKIVFNSKKIEKYLEDPNYPDSLKVKIRLIQEIKKFTIDELGFNPTDNYSKLYDQKNKPLLHVITASKKYALEPYYWKFPIVGKVTYKGYFNREEADEEVKELEAKGYECRIRIVNAFSTLGWFEDPIMSSMLYENNGDIAEVIIHELSHKTIFVKDNVDLSENLANFIGEKGAELFLIQKFGIESKEYTQYIKDAEDYKIFSQYMMKSAKSLDSLYQSSTFLTLSTDDLKEKYKNEMMLSIVNGIALLPLHDSESYVKRFTLKKMNNAIFIVYRQYNSMQDIFELDFEKSANSDLKKYIQILVERYNS